MSLLDHARTELALIDGGEADEMQAIMNAHILKMVETFADEGHSGFSASYAIGILEKLLRFEPLSPLTGEDGEWLVHDCDHDMFAQNKRCGRIFKRRDGTAYDSGAVVFRAPDGCHFTSSASRRDITFPYTPAREYVDRPA